MLVGSTTSTAPTASSSDPSSKVEQQQQQQRRGMETTCIHKRGHAHRVIKNGESPNAGTASQQGSNFQQPATAATNEDSFIPFMDHVPETISILQVQQSDKVLETQTTQTEAEEVDLLRNCDDSGIIR